MRPFRRSVPTLAAAAVATVAIAVPVLGHPDRAALAPAFAALGWTGLALAGLWGGRVWGLFALLGASTLLWASSPPAAWSLAALTLALAFALHLPALLCADRTALLLGIAIFAGTGAATGLALESLDTESREPRRIAVRSSGARTAAREVVVSIEEVPGQRVLRVTLRNPGPEPLTLDVPRGLESHHPWHSPLLDPLLRVEAFDARGRRLKHVLSFGCGMVYSSTKVVATVLPPEGTSVHVIDLPDAWYPESTVLPEYSHGMLMNPDEVSAAAPPVPATRVFVRVVYDSGAPSGSWRDDLSSGQMAPEIRVRGTSARIATSYPR